MFKKGNAKSFIAGACMAVVATGAVTAFASNYVNINASMGGIKCFWDGVEMNMKNANGDVVEPIRYNGTTYVPLRAVGNIVSKEVAYDPATEAVYIGKKPIGETLSLKDMRSRITNSGSTGYYENGTFKLKIDEYKYDNCLRNTRWVDSGNVFALDGQFSELSAKAVMPYEKVGSNATGTIEFYGVSNDGAEEVLLEKVELKQTDDPEDVTVDLTGEVNLKIVIISDNDSAAVMLYNVNFVGAGV